MNVVRTVLGDLAPDQIGITYPHEHLLVDLSLPFEPRMTTTERQRHLEPITLDNYYWIRRHHPTADLQLLDIDDAVQELSWFTLSGGRTLVEATSVGIGRDPQALAEISRRTNVNIVMGSGYYYHRHHPDDLDDKDANTLTKEIITDLRHGVGTTAIRAGIIGEIGMSWPQHPTEVKVLKAAAQAQRETGAALLIHPGRGREAPLAHVDITLECGVPPDKTIVSHVDRTLFTLDEYVKLAETGCYLEFDQFGQESHFYSHAPNTVDIPNDAQRVDMIIELASRGYLTQILVSQDVCHKSTLRKYGGEGYAHLLDNVVPLMLAKGLTRNDVEQLMVTNPQQVLPLSA